MWDIRFWTFLSIILVITGAVLAVKKFRFIDVQLVIMIAALALACDMVLCKQFGLYTWVSEDYRGWYSFWANSVIVPAWGIIFIKFTPKPIKKVVAYIIACTVLSTLFELFVAKPLGIVLYHGWSVILFSSVGYLLFLTWVYVYYRLMSTRVS